MGLTLVIAASSAADGPCVTNPKSSKSVLAQWEFAFPRSLDVKSVAFRYFLVTNDLVDEISLRKHDLASVYVREGCLQSVDEKYTFEDHIHAYAQAA